MIELHNMLGKNIYKNSLLFNKIDLSSDEQIKDNVIIKSCNWIANFTLKH